MVAPGVKRRCASSPLNRTTTSTLRHRVTCSRRGPRPLVRRQRQEILDEASRSSAPETSSRKIRRPSSFTLGVVELGENRGNRVVRLRSANHDIGEAVALDKNFDRLHFLNPSVRPDPRSESGALKG